VADQTPGEDLSSPSFSFSCPSAATDVLSLSDSKRPAALAKQDDAESQQVHPVVHLFTIKRESWFSCKKQHYEYCREEQVPSKKQKVAKPNREALSALRLLRRTRCWR
jgi:hypothetical protein